MNTNLMKNKIFSITLMLILLTISNTFYTLAEEPTRMSLPEGAKARLGKGIINEIAYSSNGKHLAVASSIGIWLYDMTTYQEISLLTGNAGPVSNVAFSPDGKTLANGRTDGTILLWDFSTP